MGAALAAMDDNWIPKQIVTCSVCGWWARIDRAQRERPRLDREQFSISTPGEWQHMPAHCSFPSNHRATFACVAFVEGFKMVASATGRPQLTGLDAAGAKDGEDADGPALK